MTAASLSATRQGYAIKRGQLDRCLSAVEEALERGENVVSVQLERSLRPVVPAVGQGMFLVAALEHVFAAQEQLFGCSQPSEPPDGRAASPAEGASPTGWSGMSVKDVTASGVQISEADAKDLTTRIRDGLGEFPLLLLEAHQRRAWIPLGHRSWEQYVRFEFNLSRSRSYELLDQARVIRALRLAAPTQRIPPISALAATQIKPVLGEVLDEVRRHVSSEQQAHVSTPIEGVVRDVVARARARVAISRAPRAISPASRLFPGPRWSALRVQSDEALQSDVAADCTAPGLVEVVALLAHQEPAADVLRSMSVHENAQLIELPQAVRWLEELCAAWSLQKAGSIQPSDQAASRAVQGTLRMSSSSAS
jgi:hypothetical protein